jgi:DNA ligase-associated metallophosphoesterase
VNKPITIQNHNFTLHPSGAMYWHEREMLLISDVHLGKVSHFRKHGSAVPKKAIAKNFEKLQDVIQSFAPKIICFLGDLFHSNLNTEWKLFEQWTSTQTAAIVLVVGNHDIISPDRYEELGVKLVSEWVLDGFLLTHIPEERDTLYNFSGHIHPGIKLRGIGRQFLKLPAFFQRKCQLILPAFGEFTGNYIMTPDKDDVVFAVTPEEVILVNTQE